MNTVATIQKQIFYALSTNRMPKLILVVDTPSAKNINIELQWPLEQLQLRLNPEIDEKGHFCFSVLEGKKCLITERNSNSRPPAFVGLLQSFQKVGSSATHSFTPGR